MSVLLIAADDDVSEANRRDSNVTSTAGHMSMSFMMGETPVNLELERNENIPQLLPFYTAEDGKLVQWTLKEGQVKYLPE